MEQRDSKKITKKELRRLVTELICEYDYCGTESEAYKQLENLGITDHDSFHSLIANINLKYKDNSWVSIRSLQEDVLEMYYDMNRYLVPKVMK